MFGGGVEQGNGGFSSVANLLAVFRILGVTSQCQQGKPICVLIDKKDMIQFSEIF